ncbi:MAG: type II toxin-antitoxin system Phd/YefM family antitoxin [bacterium]
MKASILDLRHKMKDILKALDQNEPVTILYRGKEKGIIYPLGNKRKNSGSVSGHNAFGMWKDRKDLEDVEKVINKLRDVSC